MFLNEILMQVYQGQTIMPTPPPIFMDQANGGDDVTNFILQTCCF
jgi:hypothetical protein